MKCAWTLLALLWSAAGAHPVDEVVQGAYLTLMPGKVLLELDLTPGTQVTGSIVKAIDPSSDGHVSDTEAKRFARSVLNQSTMQLGGVAVPWILEQIDVPPLDTLKLGDVIRIYAHVPRQDGVGTATFSYQNRYQPVKSQWIANVFLQPAQGWQYGVASQSHSNDGRSLTVTYRVTRP